MSDIVERLRKQPSPFDGALADEAADEIDRLREEIEIMIVGDRLRAERDRLREALETIAATGPMLTAEEASDMARAALAKEAGQ